MHRSLSLGRLALDAAGARIGGSAQARQAFLRNLASLHGLPEKVAQILDFDVIARDAAGTSGGGAAAHTLAFADARKLIEVSLGKSLDTVFRELTERPIAASIGQVHRGVLLDGRSVAVKVRYPEIANWLATDLKALGWLTAPAGMLRDGFDLKAYRHEVAARIEEELDYQGEARRTEQFWRLLRGESSLQSPELLPELCSDDVLTMTWLDGLPLASAATAPLAVRRVLAQALVRLLLLGIFRWGRLHADPNPGNLLWVGGEANPRLGIVDFGCVKTLSSPERDGLAELLASGGCGYARDEAEQLLASIGFDVARLAPVREKLPELLQLLFEPLARDEVFDLERWALGERMDALLGPHRLTFRQSGSASLIYLVRTFIGTVQLMRTLQVQVNWRASICDELDTFRQERERNAAPSLRWELPQLTQSPRLWPVESQAAAHQAKELRVRVEREGQVVAQLTFRAAVVEDLREIIPDDVLRVLEEQKFDLDAVVQRAMQLGLPPMELFSLAESEKTVRVWLE